jgi:hypothetical protein
MSPLCHVAMRFRAKVFPGFGLARIIPAIPMYLRRNDKKGPTKRVSSDV